MKAPRDRRGSDRRRRAVDVARALPFAGLFLFLVPALWGGDGAPRTAVAGLYLFGAWAGLIAVAALLARGLGGDSGDGGGGTDEP